MTITVAAKNRRLQPRVDDRVDVVVAGAGLAGLATAIQLRRAGHRVVCVEPDGWPRAAVGESLDFSTAELLADLGIPMQTLLEADAGFGKNAIEIVGSDSRRVSLWPPRWFARPPIWCSMVALHADRTELDQRAQRIALREGVELRRGRVRAVHADGVDTDPQALLATRDNAEKNHLACRIDTWLPGDFPARTTPLLLANILAGPLIELSSQFARLVAPGGQIVLSGILREQAEGVLQAYRGEFDIQQVDQDQDWVCLAGTRRNG